MPRVFAYPVRTLREHATALEAALSVCLADPDKRAVHKLRTETRRMEAQIALLKLMKGLPPFRAAAARLLKQSKKLRRAAGDVRDLDVQHKLIKDEAEKVLRDADDRPTLQKRFDELLASRDHIRVDMARKLLGILTKRQGRVAGSLEALLHALKAAEDRALPVREMVPLVDRAFGATHALRLKAPDEDDLHTIRKAAKRARYQMETVPSSVVARRTAATYDALQDAGGQWYDYLELAAIAAREFTVHHRIALAFAAERDRYLRTYERLLDQTRAARGAQPAAKPPAKASTGPASSTRA